MHGGRIELVDDDERVEWRDDLICVDIERPSIGYIWQIMEERIAIAEREDGTNGFDMAFTVDELDEKGLNKYRHWKAQMPGKISGVPDPRLTIRVCLDAHEHRFGVCNRDLTGAAVVIRKNGHWLEREITLEVPVAERLHEKLP